MNTGKCSVVIACICTACFLICCTKGKFGKWVVSNPVSNDSGYAWNSFRWANENLSGKMRERTAMLIPLSVEGCSGKFTMQFDLGSNLTMISRNTLKALEVRYPGLKAREGNNDLHNVKFYMDGATASAEDCLIMDENPAEVFLPGTATDPVSLGTMGADVFRNKILIIDYPQQRFAVCDSLPKSLRPNFTAININNEGEVILPLIIHGQSFRVLFDNGSSLFPLLIPSDKINAFSTSAPSDTITVNAWGKSYEMAGRNMRDSFTLGGKLFTGAMLYADNRNGAKDYDCIAGNALFWNSVIIIDFSNRRFAVE